MTAPPLPGHRSERGRRGTPPPVSGIVAAPSLRAWVELFYLRWLRRSADRRLKDAQYSLTGIHPSGDVFVLTDRERRMLEDRIGRLRAELQEMEDRIAAVERGGHGAPCEVRQLGGTLAERSAAGGAVTSAVGNSRAGDGARLAEPRVVVEGRPWSRTS